MPVVLHPGNRGWTYLYLRMHRPQKVSVLSRIKTDLVMSRPSWPRTADSMPWRTRLRPGYPSAPQSTVTRWRWKRSGWSSSICRVSTKAPARIRVIRWSSRSRNSICGRSTEPDERSKSFRPIKNTTKRLPGSRQSWIKLTLTPDCRALCNFIRPAVSFFAVEFAGFGQYPTNCNLPCD